MVPVQLILSSTGDIFWIPVGVFVSTCPINIKWVPFDDQLCQLRFGSWTYVGSKLNLTSTMEPIDTSSYQLNGEWHLLGGYISLPTQYYANMELW